MDKRKKTKEQTEQALKESEEKYRTLVENVNVGVYRNTGGPHGRFLYANLAIAKMFGYESVEEFTQVHVSELYQNPAERKLFIKEILKKGFIKDKELSLCRKDGTLLIASCTAKIKYSGNGRIKWIDGVIEDITERKEIEKQLEKAHQDLIKSNRKLRYLSFFDAHTGLFNYRYLQGIIEKEFQRARRQAHGLSVLMIDLDYFKSINDAYGHQFGDLVLKQFAERLKKMVRPYDIVARFGGEEFVIVFPSIDSSLALKLAERILDTIGTFSFGNRKISVKLKLSIGGASYPQDQPLSGVSLIDIADKNLSFAKEDGGNKVYFSGCKKTAITSAPEKDKEKVDIVGLKNKIEKLIKRSNQSLAETIFAFAKTISLRDHYTVKHLEETVYYTTKIAKTLNLSLQEIEHLRHAVILHDLGKIGISEKILHKKSKLTEEEYKEIRKHPVIATDILRPLQFLQEIIPAIFYHHERWDGKGYPAGLKGKEIPLGARIIALVDTFGALISERSYRHAYTKDEALRMIRKSAGTKFDPLIVKAFLKIVKI